MKKMIELKFCDYCEEGKRIVSKFSCNKCSKDLCADHISSVFSTHLGIFCEGCFDELLKNTREWIKNGSS